MSAEPNVVYRAYTADGELLYVGLSMNPVARTHAHAHDKPWWCEVATIALEHFTSRAEASQAEGQAIATECPRYNVARVRPAPVDALARQRAGRAAAKAEREAYAREHCEVLGVRCTNCGDEPQHLRRGVAVPAHECGVCGCRTLIRDESRRTEETAA